MEDVNEAQRGMPQFSDDAESLPIHCSNEVCYGRCDPLSVKIKITPATLNPTCVSDHPRRVHDGIDVCQAGLQDILGWDNIRIYFSNFGDYFRGKFSREGGTAQVGSAAEDFYSRRPGQPADVCEGYGLT